MTSKLSNLWPSMVPTQGKKGLALFSILLERKAAMATDSIV
jgi:hypothetical protein